MERRFDRRTLGEFILAWLCFSLMVWCCNSMKQAAAEEHASREARRSAVCAKNGLTYEGGFKERLFVCLDEQGRIAWFVDK